GGDDDILISGLLSYTAGTAKSVNIAMSAILAEWNSKYDFNMRLLHLTGAQGGGLNTVGSVTYVLNSSTLRDVSSQNTVVDQLTGGAGADWFLHGLGDSLLDNGSGDFTQRV